MVQKYICKSIGQKIPPVSIPVYECFSSSCGFGKNKQTAVNLLKESIKFLDEFEIDYFLISGTLLGHIRHNDFIPWDDDMDLIVHDSIIEKLPNIIKKYGDLLTFIKPIDDEDYLIKTCFINKDIIVRNQLWQTSVIQKNRRYCFPFLDMFLFTKSATTDEIIFFNKSWDFNEFYPQKQIVFNGINVMMLKNPDYFLSINYGLNYMTQLKSSSWNHREEKEYLTTKTITMEEYKKLFPK